MNRLTALAIVLLTASACTASSGDEKAPDSSSANTYSGPGGVAVTKGDPAKDTKAGDPSKPLDPSKPADPAKPGDGSTTGGGTDTKVALKTGMISLSQVQSKPADEIVNSYSVMAAFMDLTGIKVVPPQTTAKCTTSKVGDCDVTVCEVPKPKDTDPPPNPVDPPDPDEMPKAPSAGDINVSALEDVTLSPEDNGGYAPKSDEASLFRVDTPIKISATGADVPAFEKTIKGPSQIAMSAPSWPTDNTNLKVDRAKDLKLAWSYGTTGEVNAMVSATGIGTTTIKTGTIQCKWAASAGTGTITKSALGKLSATESGVISIMTQTSEVFEAGGWKITATATRPAKVGSNGVPPMVTFE